VARANPVWSDLQSASECLVVFQGPQTYITPSWYPSKRAHGRVVPTWNYTTVHCWGRPQVIEDVAWLGAQIDALTRQQEQARPEPWAVNDAPEPFVAAQIRGIVGIEIEIARIEGKWKVSQNRVGEDRAGVVAGLRAEGGSALAMASLVSNRSGKEEAKA
jgi:transcriptional regulator